ncbi:MAG: radical SAM protein [Deltaproteobacteria bacterium]|nr:radical SAM protein [Deltaproteobacteria bacterium]
MPERPRQPLELSRADLQALVESLGQPRYRGDQILAWLHGRDVLDPADMTDLPRTLRETLAAAWSPTPDSTVAEVAVSTDGTTRIDLSLHDAACTQTVLIPETPDDVEDEDDTPPPASAALPALPPLPVLPTPSPQPPIPWTRSTFTQCLSTQVGCAFGCAFCRSGSVGFVRHLSAGEILVQRHWARRTLAERGDIARTVVMGIGEPLHNLEALLAALRLLADPRAGGVSPRRITVSTIGLPEGIRRLGEEFEGRIGLAWSLHAADEETRRRLLPAASRRPVAEVVAALRAYPLPPRRRITVECVLVGGVNDSVHHARDVVRLLSGLRCKANLIPFNPWLGAKTDLAAPAVAAVEAYRETLAAAGISVFVRKPRGADVLAACGQLLGTSDGGRFPPPRDVGG